MARYSQFPELISRYEGLQTIRKLREMIRRLWKIEVAFADEEGFVVDHARGKISPSNNPFCSKCLFDSEGLKKCDQTVVEIAKKLKAGEMLRGGLFDDCHVGFKYAAVPIHVGGRFVGSVIGGGFITRELTENQKREIVAKTEPFHGLAVSDVETALRDIPLLSDAELRALLEMISFGIAEVKMVHHEVQQREAKIQELNLALEERHSSYSIVGRSPAMKRLFALLDKLTESEATVLIQGENGTGKEMVAKAIHQHSVRKDRKFISQNCSAFNENLLDTELFGHVKGSFTGAIRDKRGLFEVADGGTFFMDEIGDMSPALQVKLLRVLQEGTFIPVGGTETRQVNVRMIAASNRDLRKMVEEGLFREDLFYRLNVINIQVPPLRDRRDDIPILVEHFLRKYLRGPEETRKYFLPEALDALVAYNWPGNVRQLENEVHRAVVLAGKTLKIERELLSPTVVSATSGTAHIRLGGRLRESIEHVERQILLEGLRRHKWNKSKLSRELGVSRATLIWKIQKHGLAREARA